MWSLTNSIGKLRVWRGPSSYAVTTLTEEPDFADRVFDSKEAALKEARKVLKLAVNKKRRLTSKLKADIRDRRK